MKPVDLPQLKQDPSLPEVTSPAPAEPPNMRALMDEMIHQLHAAMVSASGSRKAALSQAELAAMREYRLAFPATVEQFVDSLLDVPNFSPTEFARVLKSRYEKQ